MGGIGSGGHNRKSSQEHARIGSRNKHRRRGLAPSPTPAAGEPERPADLKPAELAAWDELARILRAENRLTSSDGPALAAAAQALAICTRLRAQLSDRADADDEIHVLRELRQWLSVLRQSLVELACTPASRARVSAPATPPPEDAFAEFDVH